MRYRHARFRYGSTQQVLWSAWRTLPPTLCTIGRTTTTTSRWLQNSGNKNKTLMKPRQAVSLCPPFLLFSSPFSFHFVSSNRPCLVWASLRHFGSLMKRQNVSLHAYKLAFLISLRQTFFRSFALFNPSSVQQGNDKQACCPPQATHLLSLSCRGQPWDIIKRLMYIEKW